jgi:uncharacterized phiE125 gp8 family phage protein
MRNYGAIALTASSPVQSFTEPLTHGEVQAFLGLPVRVPPDDAEQDMLTGFIAGAREQAEYLQGRDLVVKQYDLSLDYFPPCEIELREPLVGVDLVRLRDSAGDYTTLAEGVGYIVDLARGLVLPPYGESWPSFTPWPSSAVLVRFRSGRTATDAFWADAGARVKIGMKHLISAWFSNRLPFELGASAVQEYPFTVTSLLSAGAKQRVR